MDDKRRDRLVCGRDILRPPVQQVRQPDKHGWGNDLKSILVIYEMVAINKVRDIYQRR